MLVPSTASVLPSIEIRLPTWEVLQETTARLLFMAVRWVRCLVPFQTLSKYDQQLLLQVITQYIVYLLVLLFRLKN